MQQYDMVTAIYETLLGERSIPVIGVENAFSDGSYCETIYTQMRESYARICSRLGNCDEDADLDQIIACMDAICAELCRKMFFLGGQFNTVSHEFPDGT